MSQQTPQILYLSFATQAWTFDSTTIQQILIENISFRSWIKGTIESVSRSKKNNFQVDIGWLSSHWQWWFTNFLLGPSSNGLYHCFVRNFIACFDKIDRLERILRQVVQTQLVRFVALFRVQWTPKSFADKASLGTTEILTLPRTFPLWLGFLWKLNRLDVLISGEVVSRYSRYPDHWWHDFTQF